MLRFRLMALAHGTLALAQIGGNGRQPSSYGSGELLEPNPPAFLDPNAFQNPLVMFSPPALNTTSAGFGRIGGQANSPRAIQFSGRVEF